MKKILINFSVFIFLLMCSCNRSYQEPQLNGWQAIFKHNGQGGVIEGNIDSLIQGIRNGYDVRVGWGWVNEIGDSLVRLEHMAKPLYLSIINEKNVSAIIDAHPLLESYFDINKQRFREGGHIWQCILNTKGEFNAQLYNRSTGALMRDWPQRQIITWFLEYPAYKRDNRKPLYSEK